MTTTLIRRMVLGGALGVVGLALAAVPAFAEGAGSVSPAVIVPGGTVTFSTVCADGVTSANVAGSPLGLSVSIPMTAGDSSGLFSADVTLPGDILPGSYGVNIDCADGSTSVVTLVVSPSGGTGSTGVGTGGVGTGGVSTGGGATSRGADTRVIVLGAGLVLLAGTGAVLVRRRAVR